jgi:Flp pilus assembly protein TadG
MKITVRTLADPIMRKSQNFFLGNQRGNVAMIFALSLVPVSLMSGFGIDIWRQNEARTAAQNAADSAALAAASGDGTTVPTLKRDAEAFMRGNLPERLRAGDYSVDVEYGKDEKIAVIVTAELPALFSGLIGRDKLPVQARAVAIRGATADDVVEIALVLDNTYSMSEDVGGGKNRLQALQAASHTLIDQVLPAGSSTDRNVRMSIVPYADYVNVGVENRNQPWVEVPADETIVQPAYTWQQTVWSNPVYTTCQGYRDGQLVTWQCIDAARSGTSTIVTHHVPESVETHTWFGCVRSRTEGNLRLSDNAPNIPYPGTLARWRNCLNPIVPLTDDRTKLTHSIDSLIISIGGYTPSTYIPAGLVWGLNTLSYTAPFTEAVRFHRGARKVLVLMSDGANTMYFSRDHGHHYDAMTTANPARHIRETDDDTLTLCDTIKRNGIEIYTIGLAVPAGQAQDLMRECASSPDKAFNASDAAALSNAFRRVGTSINHNVRLIE